MSEQFASVASSGSAKGDIVRKVSSKDHESAAMSRHELSDSDGDNKSDGSEVDSFCTDDDQRYTGILEEAHDKIREIERKPIKFWMTASGERHEYEFD